MGRRGEPRKSSKMSRMRRRKVRVARVLASLDEVLHSRRLEWVRV